MVSPLKRTVSRQAECHAAVGEVISGIIWQPCWGTGLALPPIPQDESLNGLGTCCSYQTECQRDRTQTKRTMEAAKRFSGVN